MVCSVRMRKYFLAFVVALGTAVTGYFVIWVTRKGSIVTISEKRGLSRLKSLGIGPGPLMQSSLQRLTPAPAAPSAPAEVVPTNVVAQVGTVARFNCTSTNQEPVDWKTIPYVSVEENFISIGEDVMIGDYANSGRFSVKNDSTRTRYDLVINDTKQSDAGVYICIAGRGSGNKSSAELVVWDRLTCQVSQRLDNYMGDNVFDLDPDVIRVTCRMNYKGNIRPQLLWAVGGRELNGTQGTESGLASSSLILPATSKLDGVNVTCEAVIRDRSSEVARTGVLWTSDTINIKYAVLTNEIVKECPGVENNLKCNPPCSYKLETVGDTQRCVISYSNGLGVKFFYANKSTIEKDPHYLIVTTALTAVFCFVSISLALGYLIKKLSLSRKLRNKNTDKKLLNNDDN